MPAAGFPKQDRVRAFNTLKSWIRDGTLPGGEALPAERALADRLAIGRRSVQWAVQRLDEEGLIQRVAPRTRMVVAPGSDAEPDAASTTAGVLRGAVAVLAGERLPGEDREEDYLPGWEMHVVFAAMAAVRSHERHLLKLNATVLPMPEVVELREAGIAGLIVPAFRDPAGVRATMLDSIARAGLSCVTSSDHAGDDRFLQVLPDHEGGAYALTRMLLDAGRRRIVHVGSERPSWWCQARIEGHRRAMRDAGVEPLPIQVVPDSDDPRLMSGDRATFDRTVRHNAGYLAERLTPGPAAADAVMCFSDESVSFVYAASRLFGRTPGDDLLVTGFDHFWRQSWGRAFEPTPPFATVDKNNREVGRRMVDALLNPDRGDRPRRTVIPPRVVAGDELTR